MSLTRFRESKYGLEKVLLLNQRAIFLYDIVVMYSESFNQRLMGFSLRILHNIQRWSFNDGVVQFV